MDELQREGNPHDFDYRPPDWATCGNCMNCRELLDETGTVDDYNLGACCVDGIHVVALSWTMEQAPCEGETWEG